MLIGLLSDAHGNYAAFLEGLNILSSEEVEQVFFLGDAVGYIPELNVVHELQKRDITCIRGNHEAMLLAGQLDPEKDEIYRFSDILTQMTPDERDYIGSWPENRLITADGRELMLVHGSPSDPVFGYVYPDSDLSVFSSVDADVIFMGNTHHPFIRQQGGRLFVNVGSCGLPRDSEARGCVCVYDSNNNRAKLIRYDISGSCRSLLEGNKLHESVKKLLKRTTRAELQ